jgi:hypothetical protein
MQTAQSTQKQRIIHIVIYLAIACFVIGLAGYAYMGSFIRLIGDDYCYGGVLKTDGFFGGQWRSYVGKVPYHGDRYTLTFTSFLITLFSPAINGFIPAITIVIYSGALYLLIKNLMRKLGLDLPVAFRILLAVAAAYFSLLLAPTIRQSLYFRSAMLPSFAPIVGSIFLASQLLRISKPNWYHIVLAGLFVFINGGLAENGAAFQGMVTGLLFLAALWSVRKSGWQQWHPVILPLVGAVGTIISVVVMALSPSISVVLDAGKVPLGTAISLSLRHMVDAYIGFFTTKYLIVVILVIFGFLAAILANKKDKPTFNFKSMVIHLALSQVVSLLLIFAIMVPSAYSRGVYPDPRHLIAVSVVMVFDLIFIGFIIGNQGLTIFAKLPKRMKTVSLIGSAVLLLGIAVLYPIRYLPETVQERLLYQYWAQEWTRRDKLIRETAAQGETEIHVMLLDHLIEDVGDFNPDPAKSWYNQCGADYYGIEIYADQPGWEEGFNEFLGIR